MINLKFKILFSILIVLSLSLVRAPEDKVVFLDVGQGDAILLQSGTQQVLIDGGKHDVVLRRLAEEMPFMDRRVEVVVATHPQQDHIEGLVHVLKRYDVGLVILPEVKHGSDIYAELIKEIIERDIEYRYARAGQELKLHNIDIQIVWPESSEAARAAIKSDLNNASVVARVDYRGLSFLMTGDIEKRVEKLLRGNLRADILKVGHHGSNSSTYEPLLRAVSPSAAVISVGEDNKFGHPRDEVLQRLGDIPVWRTDEDGSVKFWWEKGEWWVK